MEVWPIFPCLDSKEEWEANVVLRFNAVDAFDSETARAAPRRILVSPQKLAWASWVMRGRRDANNNNIGAHSSEVIERYFFIRGIECIWIDHYCKTLNINFEHSTRRPLNKVTIGKPLLR